MTVVEHLFTGLFIGEAIEHKSLYIALASVLGSLLPDVDIVHGRPGTIGYLDKHRTYTHSLWFAIASSFMLSLFLFVLYSFLNCKFRPDYILILLGCLSGTIVHLLFDVLNAFGTSIWWPQKDRIAIDILYEFDLAVSVIMLIGTVIHYWTRVEEYRFALIVTFSLMPILYALLRFISRIYFKKRVKNKFWHLLNQETKASFVPASLWRWKAILETEDRHYVIREHRRDLNCEVRPKTDIPRDMQVKEVNIYKKYARHLDVRVRNKSLHLSNLIYSLNLYPLTGCFVDSGNPLIKIGKPKWLRLLRERRY